MFNQIINICVQITDVFPPKTLFKAKRIHLQTSIITKLQRAFSASLRF